MKLEENEGFLTYQQTNATQFDNRSCGRSEGMRSRSSIIISQSANRSIFSPRISSAAEIHGFMLGESEEEEYEDMYPLLFTQLNELVTMQEDVEWRETARWIKFEEKTEDGANRWSKPHVTTLTLHSLFELRTSIEKGTILLDTESSTFKDIVENVMNLKIARNSINQEEKKKISYILNQKHVHQTQKSWIRTVADNLSSCNGNKTQKGATVEFSEKPLKEQLKNKFRKKIPTGTEAANILVGEVDFLEKPFASFIRLKEAVVLGSLNEVALPSRFIFILLGPRKKSKTYHEIGRAIATLLTDELFRKIAYSALTKEALIAGIDDFLDELTVLPPGKSDPTVRIQPPKFLPSPQKRKSNLLRESKSYCNGNSQSPHGHPHVSEELKKTGKFFGGLVKDLRRKAPWYWSDFYDALNIQCLSTIIFIYLATATNAITFGGMLGDATDNMQGVIENFLGTAITGALFCLFSGQPLTILSSTGPVLVFERLLYNFSKDYQLEYLEFRLWIGLWVAFYCLILVATEASFLVQYFTRFTEESFCALISFIFIYDAIKKMMNLADQFPINWQYRLNNVTQNSCACILPDGGNDSSIDRMEYRIINSSAHTNSDFLDWAQFTQSLCKDFKGHLEGNNCNYVPDIYLMSILLFFGTFFCVSSLKSFQNSRFLSSSIRKLTADFSVILTILIFCAIDFICGLETPKLTVPNEFKPTNPNRSWVVFPFGANPWWVCLLSGIPAILITILVFMDQQITAVILNRKEYKLKKGAGLHLDFFCIAILIILTSFMGLPWYVSATVISLAHMNSLKMETTQTAPGEQPTFLGIREQRVTGLAVFILTGTSVFLSPVLKYIPMPVLYGIFLQMGVAALGSIQFMDRLQLLFIPSKHQPDNIYLRHVPLQKVHLFTLIQVLCLAILWILKSTVAAIIFPLMLLALAGIRKAMEWIFSQYELSWLDDILPQNNRKEAESKMEDIDSSDSETSELKYQGKNPEINISVNL
ncbi:electrogenic sodium bicarbonate cotransporter 1-like [Pelobates fuscus]|uniref:electrogenic sodium bicarbonate cotransporter 1-like n=1 Tax=Pelobates fuscus TaxID=191477 RepID=UPI002FE49755